MTHADNIADRARRELLGDLGIMRRKLLTDAERCEHHAQALRREILACEETAEFKRAKASAVEECTHHLQHPATGVDLTADLDANMHRALQGGPR